MSKSAAQVTNPPLTQHRIPNPQHRCPHPQHRCPNPPFPVGHRNSLVLWFVSKHLLNHRAQLCLWRAIRRSKASMKTEGMASYVPLVGKQVFHGHCLVTPCRDRELSLGKAPCGTLASDSSAITALSQEDLVASKNHFQTCPSCKNQRIELPIIPTVRHDNSTCVPTKGKGKAWSIDYSSHALQ